MTRNLNEFHICNRDQHVNTKLNVNQSKPVNKKLCICYLINRLSNVFLQIITNIINLEYTISSHTKIPNYIKSSNAQILIHKYKHLYKVKRKTTKKKSKN